MKAVAIVCLIVMLLATGCQFIDHSRIPDDETDSIPWNTRAPWEDTVIGVPY